MSVPTAQDIDKTIIRARSTLTILTGAIALISLEIAFEVAKFAHDGRISEVIAVVTCIQLLWLVPSIPYSMYLKLKYMELLLQKYGRA